jgi:NAD(P) transhydrogenase
LTEKEPIVALTPWQEQVRSVALTTGGVGTALALGKFTNPAFMNLTTTLALAGMIGFRAVWSVTPALHSPLMCESHRVSRAELTCVAVTNALSGLVGVGGLFVMGGGWVPHTFPELLAASSVFLANVSESAHSRRSDRK